MQDYDYLKIIDERIRAYANFPLPASVYCPDFDVCWGNQPAKSRCPAMCTRDGIDQLLAELSPEEINRTLLEEGSLTIVDPLPLSSLNLCLQAIEANGRLLGFSLLALGSDGGLIPNYPLRASKTAEMLSDGVRGAVASIIQTMDAASLKADQLRAGWVKSCLHSISIENHRILRITTNLSEYTKLQSGVADLRFAAVDIAGLMEEIHAVSVSVGDALGIPITLTLTPPIPMIRADRSYLELAITNLIHNSLYYTRDKNTISISVRGMDGYVRIVLKDRGIGIPPSVLPNIYAPYSYYDNDRRGAGMGLGLTLARQIVQAHNGQITVRSQPQKGTTVTLDIPPAGFSSAVALGRNDRRGEMGHRLSRLHIGLVDAMLSPYRELMPDGEPPG